MAGLVSVDHDVPCRPTSGSIIHRTSAQISPLNAEGNIIGDKGHSVDIVHSVDSHNPVKVQKLMEEVCQLQAKNNRLDGKLRGYHTLNELFQESKQECFNLRRQNSELSEKIRSMDEKVFTVETEGSQEKMEPVELVCVNPSKCAHTMDKSNPTPISSQDIQNNSTDNNTTDKTNSVGAEPKPNNSATATSESVEDRPGGCKIPTELSEEVTQDSIIASEEEMQVWDFSIQGSAHKTSDYGGVSNLQSFAISMQPETSDTSRLLFNTSETSHLESSGDRFSIPRQVSSSGPETTDIERQGGSAVSIHVADELDKTIGQIRKLEKSERAWKAFASTLQSQVQELKMRLRSTCQEKDAMLSSLKAESLRLLQKIKKLEHERDVISPSDSINSQTALVEGEFVHVSKEQVTSVGNDSENKEDSISSLLLKLQALELKNKQLYQANKEWVTFKQNTELMHNQKLQELREQNNAKERALTEFQIQDENRQRDIDKIILTSKRRGHLFEEENEDLKVQLSQSKRRIEELLDNVTALSQQQREPINQLSGPATPVSPTSPSHLDPALQEVLDEKEALKHQLTVFQEDFNNERSDRAKAQSDKDDLNRQLTEAKKNLRRLQNQQKNTEETLQSTITENEQLHQQIANLRRQLNMSEESKRKCTAESEHHRKESQELRQKLSRQQDIMRPPVTRTPYYPPYGMRNPGWQDYGGFYQPQPAEPGPELLPGSWQCSKCTFVNFPRRTVCEVCGAVHQQKQDQPLQYMPYHWQMTNQDANPQNQGSQQLIPRGLDDVDLTCDNGGHVG